LIIISFSIVLGIKEYEYTKYDNSGNHMSNSENTELKFISFMLSFTIQVLNFFISVCVRLFSSYEKHTTWTKYNVSVFHMLVVSTTLNTVIVLFLVNSINIQDNYFNPAGGGNIHWFQQEYGLPNDLFNFFLIDAFLTPVILIFSPKYLFQLWSRRSIRNGKKVVTQAEANRIWKNPEIDLAQRSARYVKTLLTVLVFAPIFPMGFFMGVISVFMQYWADKILLLRRYSRSQNIGKGLALAVLKWLPISYLFYTVCFM
jgi:hypothetical protein